MNGTFNGQILVEKLAKLNNSQQSIETLSHWCIFHRKKAKLVVETWDRQFHCSPQEQRVSFLYLANDILQNSRRKGSEFVGEFWKVLPDALTDVIENGDEFGTFAALRLIDIWEERKSFGCQGQILKEELVGRNLEKSNKNGKSSGFKLGSLMDLDLWMGCGASIVFWKNEFKLDQVRNQLKVVQSRYGQAGNICQQVLKCNNGQLLVEQRLKETNISSDAPSSFLRETPVISIDKEQSARVMYIQQGSLSDNIAHIEEDSCKSAASAVVAKLTASTSSAQMLTYVLSSLASEGGVIGNRSSEPSGDYPSEKRPKLERGGHLRTWFSILSHHHSFFHILNRSSTQSQQCPNGWHINQHLHRHLLCPI
ncbi:hypothetical protein NE237_008126 [Protea cynaroides]|uniref:CID domain-containing protein n=1 Tax=Protea cynaroides TaxID=273540 RepID=A0A9Q0QX28_9MAGN|nr:hypothetical protein NE237_008126 [Protea cynaroides]